MVLHPLTPCEQNLNFQVHKQSKVKCAVVWKSDCGTENVHISRGEGIRGREGDEESDN